jgi:hypothetical protein
VPGAGTARFSRQPTQGVQASIFAKTVTELALTHWLVPFKKSWFSSSLMTLILSPGIFLLAFFSCLISTVFQDRVWSLWKVWLSGDVEKDWICREGRGTSRVDSVRLVLTLPLSMSAAPCVSAPGHSCNSQGGSCP